MPKVSVIVPVYNPGSHIDDCIESLLGQTLPPDELELIFVDDGSTDATPARLDALAERAPPRPGPSTSRTPAGPASRATSGSTWPRGDYVYFVDNDDWLERDALERLHATALQDRADIVIGKVVGHGKGVPLRLFEANRHAVALRAPTCCCGLLTPHKLFRRRAARRARPPLPRGPAPARGPRPFVVSAYFARGAHLGAGRPSRLPLDAPRGPGQRLLPALRRRRATTTTCARCSTSSSRAREPGPFRDQLLLHWYRGKMLGRVGGRDWLWRDADFRRELYDAIRPLALERFGEDVARAPAVQPAPALEAAARAATSTRSARLSRFERRLRARRARPRHRARRHARGAAARVLVRRGEDQAALRAQGRPHVLAAADAISCRSDARRGRPRGHRRAARARAPRCSCATSRTAAEYLLPAPDPRCGWRRPESGRVRPGCRRSCRSRPPPRPPAARCRPGAGRCHITLDVARLPAHRARAAARRAAGPHRPTRPAGSWSATPRRRPRGPRPARTAACRGP